MTENVINSKVLNKALVQRKIVKSLSRKMILESKLSKFFKFLFNITMVLIIIYSVNHIVVFDHLFHIHQPPLH
jgi:hypothetical protein